MKLHWVPRILAILFILSISIFSLDAQSFLGWIIHMIPSFALIGFLVLAWFYPLTGGVIWFLTGLLFTQFFHTYRSNLTFILISGPAFLIGLLFVTVYLRKDLKFVSKALWGYIIFLIIMLLIAGKLNYWQGWIYFLYSIIILLLTFFLFKNKQDFLKERIHPGKGMKFWDKVFFAVYLPLFFAQFFFSIIDGIYQINIFLYLIGYVLYSTSIAIFFWSMLINNYFSSVVRIQKDRNQKVCQAGPYKYVRHPGYVAGIIMSLGFPLLFGSYFGLWFAIPIVLAFIVRTYLEDKTLQKELKGYKQYTKKVKYRLIPYIW